MAMSIDPAHREQRICGNDWMKCLMSSDHSLRFVLHHPVRGLHNSLCGKGEVSVETCPHNPGSDCRSTPEFKHPPPGLEVGTKLVENNVSLRVVD